MFSLTLTKVLLTSLGCGLAVKQVAYGGVFLIRTPLISSFLILQFLFICIVLCYPRFIVDSSIFRSIGPYDWFFRI